MDWIIETEQIVKGYKQFALGPISLNVPRGYITGLIGANGAGKSTLIRLLMGMSLPRAGSVRLFGRDVAMHPADVKGRIGYVPDHSAFYEHLTIASMKRIYAPFYRQWDEVQFQQYLQRFELSPKAKIRGLSTGMRMKFALALALSHHAELLIMDEPTSGLDPVFRRELLEILRELMINENMTILFSTHITSDLERIADYIAFMQQGKLVFNESRETLLERYVVVRGGQELLDTDIRRTFIGFRETDVGFEGLMDGRDQARQLFSGLARIESATLEDIMYFNAKGGRI